MVFYKIAKDTDTYFVPPMEIYTYGNYGNEYSHPTFQFLMNFKAFCLFNRHLAAISNPKIEEKSELAECKIFKSFLMD